MGEQGRGILMMILRRGVLEISPEEDGLEQDLQELREGKMGKKRMLSRGYMGCLSIHD